MKTHSKNIFYIVSFFLMLLVGGNCHATTRSSKASSTQPTSPALNLTPFTGVNFGKTEELLFSSTNSDTLVSKLDWHNKPFYLVGLQGEFVYGRFFFDSSFTYYLPLYCGKMTDSDYSKNFVTNYCTFDNYSNLSFDANLNLGYKFYFGKSTHSNVASNSPTFYISPILNITYFHRSFSTKNGTGFFGVSKYTGLTEDVPYTDENARKAIFVSPIDYKLQSLNIFTGVSFGINYKKHFINTSFLISPYKYNYTHDFHSDVTGNNPYNTYTQTHSGFNSILFNINYLYKINERVSFYFLGEFTKAFVSTSLIITDYNTKYSYGIFAQNKLYKTGQKGGASFTQIKLALGVKLRVM